MEKKEKRFLVIGVALALSLLLLFVLYRVEKWDEKDARERRRVEKEEAQKEVEKPIEEFVDEYIHQLQNRIRGNGIEDIQITYQSYSKEEYEQRWHNIRDHEWEDSDADFVFYYIIEGYQSESIDQIYAEKTKDGDFQSYKTLMETECNIKEENELYAGDRQEFSWNDKEIVVYIADRNTWGELTIQNPPDQSYKYERGLYELKLYANNQVVYEEDVKQYTSYDSVLNDLRKKSNNTGNSSSWNSSSSKSYDPYGVYDYDDPDDFADEWGEEFGDGNYDDGYDDAYDYWEEKMN